MGMVLSFVLIAHGIFAVYHPQDELLLTLECCRGHLYSYAELIYGITSLINGLTLLKCKSHLKLLELLFLTLYTGTLVLFAREVSICKEVYEGDGQIEHVSAH
jgi:hypothetical protein